MNIYAEIPPSQIAAEKTYIRSAIFKLLPYKEEGYAMYEAMLSAISEEVTKTIFRVKLRANVQREQVATPVIASHGEGEIQKKPVTRSKEKVGRNDPCPCGSGKKYKKCCGQ